ncbi:hypothetical protein [Desulfosarcina ovata]|uniref:hypothetical protein n=1 Tax=Desulfosarcina ovata TaxID=83564 RepID=UPI0012D2A8FF|nr:hypothetical protein [Desulfosarcina ovata]
MQFHLFSQPGDAILDDTHFFHPAALGQQVDLADVGLNAGHQQIQHFISDQVDGVFSLRECQHRQPAKQFFRVDKGARRFTGNDPVDFISGRRD